MNDFVWADLSTYDTHKSKKFYEQVFGWKFYEVGGYFVAMQGSAEVVGLFETPDFFQKIKMPHFWMSYIAVDDALATAELATEFESAKVELTDDFYGGQIALIRDPQGAGFTVYDGRKLDSKRLRTGNLIWNELHVSDASPVIPFYERLFGWTITAGEPPGKYHVINSNGQHVTDISVIPNELKGKYEYWVCSFAVDNLNQATKRIVESGGDVVYDEGDRRLIHDNSGEAFFYIQCIDVG